MTENEIRAIAVREVAGYIERIHRPGLVNLVTVLMDLEAAAARMEQGMTARGSFRSGVVAEEPEWESESIQYGHLLAEGLFIVEHRGKNYSTHQRRIKFGRPTSSWAPVEQEGTD